MNITQLTDEQLSARTDRLCQIFLASCELDHDYIELERALDAHFHEAQRREVFCNV